MEFKFNKKDDEKEVSNPVVEAKEVVEAPTEEAPKEEVKKEADEAAAKKERIRKRNLGYI